MTTAERATADYQEPTFESHVGDVALRRWSHDRPVPSVVIGVYGCIATALIGHGSSEWSAEVFNLLNIQIIEVLVVDETSQLRDG